MVVVGLVMFTDGLDLTIFRRFLDFALGSECCANLLG